MPVENARGRFGKIMDSNIIFLGGWARCRAGRFSNVDEVLRVSHDRYELAAFSLSYKLTRVLGEDGLRFDSQRFFG
ncbi:MAG: hypothetical protein CAK90_08645 [Spartobacteria bacterium AMD-G4]|nr:MAG: hypothetical protein CAK90_08645 [Spartobacteria bacterium AMD-G4]